MALLPAHQAALAVAREPADDGSAFVFACGPEALVNESWDVVNAERAKHKGAKIEFHVRHMAALSQALTLFLVSSQHEIFYF